ncbi:thioredoxin [Serratia phage 4S]|nr:thioredoxin [Serratia phage 4S]
MLDGKEKGVWVFKENVQFSDNILEVAPEQTDEELLTQIRKRFNVMSMMADGIIAGHVRSLIISGAAGVGKTYELDKKLTGAKDADMIQYFMLNSKCSAIGLYVKLYEARESNSVLLLDDVDVFSDMDTLNLLKAALDTGEKRHICWNTASSWLEDQDIPRAFEFEGTCVFITNMDIDRELDKGGKLSPHINALVSRSVYLDLKVHTNREIMLRVQDIIMNTSMLQKRGLSASQVMEVLDWMKFNMATLRNVSLRTALHIADFVKTDERNWRDIATVTMLSN